MQSVPTRLIPVVLAAMLAVSACSSNDDVAALPELPPEESTTSRPSTTSSISSTTTSTTKPAGTIPTPDDGEAFDAYIADRLENFFEAVDQATSSPTSSPETDYPAFEELAAGDQLAIVYESVKRFAADGERIREPEEPAVGTSIDEEFRISRVVSVEGSRITVNVCKVDDEDIIKVDSGEVVVSGVITIQSIATLEEIDGSWKLTSTEVVDKLEGVGGCYFANETAYPF